MIDTYNNCGKAIYTLYVPVLSVYVVAARSQLSVKNLFSKCINICTDGKKNLSGYTNALCIDIA